MLFFHDVGATPAPANGPAGSFAAWLWFTVLFANFAEAMAEGAARRRRTLRKTRAETVAHRRRRRRHREVPCSQLACRRRGRRHAGEVIPGDGDVIEGVAWVDESAITASGRR